MTQSTADDRVLNEQNVKPRRIVSSVVGGPEYARACGWALSDRVPHPADASPDQTDASDQSQKTD